MKIISGGQTGVDYTALVVAQRLGIPTGGTAPKGWRTESGSNPDLANFGLVESHATNYRTRTAKNVYDSDGTVWFGDCRSPGGVLTLNCCRHYEKPYLVNPTAEELRTWIAAHNIRIMNVAGNRWSTNPAASDLADDVLTVAFES